MRNYTLILLATLSAAVWGDEAIILATTTSTHDSGLLDVLVPAFEKESGISVKTIAVGSGAAIKMAETGDADVVLAHSPEAEQKAIAAGYLIHGCAVMHNDMVLVGPKDDPAGVRGTASAADAMAAIARHGRFISRGDESGTHRAEMALWREAGVDPTTLPAREETGQGMGNTLSIASEKKSYALTDRGTWRSMSSRLELEIVFSGDTKLMNFYHAYVVDPARHQHVNAEAATKFVDYLVSDAGQRVIASFRVEGGAPLFTPERPPSPDR
jgi:tungstate transport system substrate-binding protein